MIEGIPKISVLVICYNQEKVISRAIESLLAQKDYLYEICVSDDCSRDRTWEILLEYSAKYPGLFVLNRNESNIGIFENIEKTWTMPSGDIIYSLAGDDECGEGWFSKVIDFIIEKKIDYTKELFCIYGDYEVIYPNGDSMIIRNNLVSSKLDVLSLALRGYVSNRSSCYSRFIKDKFIKVSQGKSHIAELAIDRQRQIFSERNYYIPHVGNRYYTGIGVSHSMSIDTLREREQIRPYALSIFDRLNVKLKEKDRYYMLFQKETLTAKIEKDHSNKLLRIKYKLKSIDFNFSFKKNSIKKTLFLLIRKIPHKTPLHLIY